MDETKLKRLKELLDELYECGKSDPEVSEYYRGRIAASIRADIYILVGEVSHPSAEKVG